MPIASAVEKKEKEGGKKRKGKKKKGRGGRAYAYCVGSDGAHHRAVHVCCVVEFV